MTASRCLALVVVPITAKGGLSREAQTRYPSARATAFQSNPICDEPPVELSAGAVSCASPRFAHGSTRARWNVAGSDSVEGQPGKNDSTYHCTRLPASGTV